MGVLFFVIAAEVADRVAEVADRVAEVADRVAEVADRVAEVADRVAEVADRVIEVADRVVEVADKTLIRYFAADFELKNNSPFKKMLSVQTASQSGEIAVISNTNKKIDFFAPGMNILSTIPGGGLGIKSGTSMAAPHVTGGLALLLNDYTHEELTAFLLSRRKNRLAKAGVLDLLSFYGIGEYYGRTRVNQPY